MTFVAQTDSEVYKGWPKVGKHIGLLIDDSVEVAPTYKWKALGMRLVQQKDLTWKTESL